MSQDQRPESSPEHQPEGMQIRLGKTTAAIAKGASGAVAIYGGSTKGSETAVSPAVTIQAYARMGAVAISKWVYVGWVFNGWEILGPEC